MVAFVSALKREGVFAIITPAAAKPATVREEPTFAADPEPPGSAAG